MVTREQARARFALDKVRSILQHADKAKYKTQLLKLPARLHSSGLGQTVAFYLSAASKREADICDWLRDWLRNAQICPRDQELIDFIVGTGAATADEAESRYRRASTEVRALAMWLQRFAEAFIAGDAE